METDDSSRMNHHRAPVMNSTENKNSNLDNAMLDVDRCPLNCLDTGKQRDSDRTLTAMHEEWHRQQQQQQCTTKSRGVTMDNDDCDDDDQRREAGQQQRRRRLTIGDGAIVQLRPLARKLRALCLLISLLMLLCCLAEAGFWTFYFPNFLKPSGYTEIKDMIYNVEVEINATEDTFADVKYFWRLMKEMDDVDESTIYPEESVCNEVFPMFREIAIEYSFIDYEHYIGPMLAYRNYLVEAREQWYPEGEKSRTILPREWEQKLYEADLEAKIKWHKQLTDDLAYRAMRDRLVNIWRSVKRSLDTSLPCVYLRYAYRQVSEDINQFALEMNLHRMQKAMEMLKAAYKRIDKFKASDEKAKKTIADVLSMEERLEIRT